MEGVVEQRCGLSVPSFLLPGQACDSPVIIATTFPPDRPRVLSRIIARAQPGPPVTGPGMDLARFNMPASPAVSTVWTVRGSPSGTRSPRRVWRAVLPAR